MSNNTAQLNEYYKVSFYTTHSRNIPQLLKQTGGLIIMSEVDNEHRKSIWFRGDLIASGYGFTNPQMVIDASWFFNRGGDTIMGTYNNVFGGPYGANTFNTTYMINEGHTDEPGIYNNDYSVYGRLTYINEIYIPATYEKLAGNVSYVQDNLISVYTDTWSYMQSSYAILSDEISYLDKTLVDTFTYTQDYILSSYLSLYDDLLDMHQEMNDRFKNTYNVCNSYLTLAINYTNSQINKLIGEAPDTLDTLAEISYMLAKAKDDGINTVKEIVNIKNNYITHDALDKNGFTYMSEYSTMEVPHTGVGEYYYEDGKKYYPGSYSYIDADGNSQTVDPKNVEWINWVENNWHKDTYEYTFYEEEPLGKNAIKDNQVSTHYNNVELDKILDLLLQPYPYQTPIAYITKIGTKTPEEYGPVEIGTRINTRFEIYTYVGDSSNLIQIKSVSPSGMYNDNSLRVINKQPGSLPTLEMSNQVMLDLSKEGWNIVSQGTQISYSDAVHQPWPQLKTLDPPIYDDKNVFYSATYTYTQSNIGINAYYRTVYGSCNEENSNIITGETFTNAKFENADGFFIDDKVLEYDWHNDNSIFWFSIPESKKIKEVKVIDKNSGEEDILWVGNGGNPIQYNSLGESGVFESDILKLDYRQSSFQRYVVPESAIRPYYDVYIIKNVKFVAPTEYKVIVELI